MSNWTITNVEDGQTGKWGATITHPLNEFKASAMLEITDINNSLLNNLPQSEKDKYKAGDTIIIVILDPIDTGNSTETISVNLKKKTDLANGNKIFTVAYDNTPGERKAKVGDRSGKKISDDKGGFDPFS